MSLRPCTSCRRLVRASDAVCPFCSATPGPFEARAAEPPQRRARAAMLAGALTVAAGTVACSPGMVSVYGGPPADLRDAGPSAVTPDPVPPPEAADAGHASVAPQPVPTTGPVAMYGAPPRP